MTATLIERFDNAIDVQWRDGKRETIPLYEVGKIEVSEGRKRAPVRGALYGTAVGVGVGLILRSRQHDDYVPGTTVNNNLFPVSTIGGTVMGALVGTFGSERWRTIYSTAPSERIGLVPAAGPKRFALVVSRAF